MSQKNRDNKNCWRSKTVAFRVSPEEDKQIETAVRLSGLTKQDYIVRRLSVPGRGGAGQPRVYKALRNQLAAVLDEIRRIENGGRRGRRAAGYHSDDRRYYGRHEGGSINRWIRRKRKKLSRFRLLAQTGKSPFPKQLSQV